MNSYIHFVHMFDRTQKLIICKWMYISRVKYIDEKYLKRRIIELITIIKRKEKEKKMDDTD